MEQRYQFGIVRAVKSLMYLNRESITSLGRTRAPSENVSNVAQLNLWARKGPLIPGWILASLLFTFPSTSRMRNSSERHIQQQ